MQIGNWFSHRIWNCYCIAKKSFHRLVQPKPAKDKMKRYPTGINKKKTKYTIHFGDFKKKDLVDLY